MGFFTKSAKEGQVVLYDINNGLSLKNKYKHSNPNNAFGLSRQITMVYSELTFIFQQIPKTRFNDIKWNYQIPKNNLVFIDSLNSIEISNKLNNSKLNGKYLLVIQKPIPWAWAKNIENITMDAKAIILDIKKKNCE